MAAVLFSLADGARCAVQHRHGAAEHPPGRRLPCGPACTARAGAVAGTLLPPRPGFRIPVDGAVPSAPISMMPRWRASGR